MPIQPRIKALLDRIRANGLVGQLTRGGIGSIAIKFSNTLLGLALAIVLARALGPEGYGTYAYVLALVSILAIPAQFGLPRLVVRETAKAQVSEKWGLMRGIWRWSSITALISSVGVAIIAATLAWLWSAHFSQMQLATLFFGLLLVPLMVMGNLRGAALQGLRRVVWGQMPEMILRPGFLILFLLMIIGWSSQALTASQAMGLHVMAAGTAFIIGALLLFRSRPDPLRAHPMPVYETRAWLMSAWPLALTAGMQQININTDIIMLGFFVPAEEVGIYRVAVQGGLLVVFGLSVVSMFVSPYFARLHVQGDHERLQRLVTIGARAAFFAALPTFLVFAFLGDVIIRFLFGAAYVNAYIPLLILSFGQLINALFGNVALLLNMTGHERDTLRGMAIAAGSNIALNILLIPLFGLNGAAFATALTLLIWNLILWRSVQKRLNINSVIFVHLG